MRSSQKKRTSNSSFFSPNISLTSYGNGRFAQMSFRNTYTKHKGHIFFSPNIRERERGSNYVVKLIDLSKKA